MDNLAREYFEEAIKTNSRHPAILSVYQRFLNGELKTREEQKEAYVEACLLEREDLLQNINKALSQSNLPVLQEVVQ